MHRKNAAGLASQASQLAALFAKEVQEDFGASFAHCKQALAYAQLAEDHRLIAASFIREVDALFCRNRYAQIHQVLQQAEYSPSEASPLMRGRISCHLAVSYAKHEQEQEALRSIELAQETFPAHPESDPGFLYTHTDDYILYLHKVALFLHLNRPQEAWQAIVRAGNFVPNNVSPRRAELLSETVTASLALNDVEQSCFYFEKLAMLGTALGANLFMSEAQTSYQEMQMKWPHEARIKSPGKLFAKEDRKERIESSDLLSSLCSSTGETSQLVHES